MKTTDNKFLKISPLEIERVKELSIIQSAGEHAYAYIVALIREDKGESFVSSASGVKQVTISLPEGKMIFSGVIESIEVECVANVYEARITLSSNTSLLDRKLMNRSFQDVSMKYDAMIGKIGNTYGNFNCGCSISLPALKKFTMQYEETDWQFFQRMASHFNLPLVADISVDYPKFFIGPEFGVQLPPTKEVLERSYTVSKYVSTFAEYDANLDKKDDPGKKVPENAALVYDFEFTGNDSYKVGDGIRFLEKDLYIRQINTYLGEDILRHHVKCVERDGFFVPKQYNYQVAGLSLKAKVENAKQDKLEVIFSEIEGQSEIEDQSRDTPYPFSYVTPYSTKDNTGIYFMPEKDDIVLINFPTENENDAVACGSLRKEDVQDDKLDDPKVKYIRTDDGKEIMLGEDEIRISTKDDNLFILISEKEGITISSSKPIQIKSDEEIVLNSAKTLELEANKEMTLKCKSSEITLGATMDIKADIVAN